MAPLGSGDRARVELELLLDYVGARSASVTSYALDAQWQDAVPSGDAAFRQGLVQFLEALPSDAKQSQSFATFSKALREAFPRGITGLAAVRRQLPCAIGRDPRERAVSRTVSSIEWPADKHSRRSVG